MELVSNKTRKWASISREKSRGGGRECSTSASIKSAQSRCLTRCQCSLSFLLGKPTANV